MTDPQVHMSVEAGVAVISLDCPPANALSPRICQMLGRAFERAAQDDQVSVIVLGAEGQRFCSGIEIGRIADDDMLSALADLCNQVEGCIKPVVAAVHGVALGGGFSLALAAHYRVMRKGARIGFPEVRLGLLPVAGGTQRAARLAGARNALALMLSGQQVDVSSPAAAPYVDEIAVGSALESAIRFALGLAEKGAEPRRSMEASSGFADRRAYLAEVERQKYTLADGPEPARSEIVQAVEAALLLPAEAGMAFEAASFAKLAKSPQSEALKHLFKAERMAARPPLGKANRVVQLGIAGGGPIAIALTMAGLEHGFSVAHFAESTQTEDIVANTVKAALERAVDARLMSKREEKSRLDRLVQATDPAVVAGCEVIVGCGPDQARLLSATGEHALPFACLATTSLFALVADSPLLGLAMDSETDLAEVLWSQESLPDDVATLMTVLRRLGRQAVACKTSEPPSQSLRRGQEDLITALAVQGVPPERTRVLARREEMLFPMVKAQALANETPPDDAEVLAFLQAGMAAKGMELLRSGAVATASDIDVIATQALGYARWCGGPMHMAEAQGLVRLEKAIARFVEIAPDLFKPDDGLDAAIRAGGGWKNFV